jgi:hypothetical protein
MGRHRSGVILVFALAWLASVASASASTGFGGAATGGQGRRVVEVVTLADNLQGSPVIPGSLRAALSGGNRIVRFRVSGNIRLTHALVVSGSNVTIDGGDAPGGGVALWNHSLVLGGDNLIVRHLRFRGNHPTEPHQGLEIGGGTDVLIDHVSCSWTTDECIAIYGYEATGPLRRVTIQNSLIAEAPDDSRFGTSGMLVDGDVSDVTWYGNVFAKNKNRNPQITTGRRGRNGPELTGTGRYELIQNVVYDAIYGTRVWNQSSRWAIELDAIGNLWLPGPQSWPSPKVPIMIFMKPASLGPIRVFLRNNVGPPRWDLTGDPCDDFSLESANTPCAGWAPAHDATTRQVSHYLLPSAGAVSRMDTILANVGATRPCRDSADRRILAELRAGTSSTVRLPKQLPDLSRPCS